MASGHGLVKETERNLGEKWVPESGLLLRGIQSLWVGGEYRRLWNFEQEKQINAISRD